jgi:hypothetical protein
MRHWNYSISLVLANKQQFNINTLHYLYYLSGTALGDIHIHAITTYNTMYLISVKTVHTLTVNKKSEWLKSVVKLTTNKVCSPKLVAVPTLYNLNAIQKVPLNCVGINQFRSSWRWDDLSFVNTSHVQLVGGVRLAPKVQSINTLILQPEASRPYSGTRLLLRVQYACKVCQV